MTARRRKARYASGWIDWSPEVAELCGTFRVLTAGLEPPARVRLYDGKGHTTIVAKFRRPESGGLVTLTMRRGKAAR